MVRPTAGFYDGRSHGAGDVTLRMEDRQEASFLDRLWRQRRLIVASVVVAAAAAAVITSQLPKVYTASSKLLVVQTRHNETFDAIQAAQVTARTYSDVLSSPNIARLVADRLPATTTPGEVNAAVSIQPIPETQLLEVRANAATPVQAKALADTYGQVFIDYARRQLQPTTGATVTLADAAPLAGAPSKPRPKLYVFLACLLALPLSIGLALLRDRLDSRLRSVEDLEERLGMPVLARIPRRSRSEAAIAAFDEAFRILRTSLRFTTPEGGARTLAITSAWEGEGKTTTTLNLASAALEAGQRVLLVEADFYKPNLLKNLEVRPDFDRLGLIDYLRGAADLDEIIHPTSTPGLTIIPAGRRPGSPSFSALLESERGQALVPDVAGAADLVLFDCPPLGPRADAAMIASGAEGVLLVVDLQVTTEHRLHRALLQLQSVNALLIGAVVNRDTSFKPSHYQYMREDRDRDVLPADMEYSERS